MRQSNLTRNAGHFRPRVRASLSIALVCSLAVSVPGLPTGAKTGDGILSPVQASAADIITDSETHFTYSLYKDKNGEEKAEITGYEGTDWNLTIDKVKNGEKEIPVGKIKEEAFKENEKVTGLTIAENAEVEIGKSAFSGCKNLQSVSLPFTVTWPLSSGGPGFSFSVHDGYQFENCTSLTNLTLADGITVLPEHIFHGCTALTALRLPSRLESFENGAFEKCTALSVLEIPDGVQEIGRAGFQECTSLTSVSFPASIQRWCISEHLQYSNHAQNENAAFSGCTSLEKVTFAEGMTTLGASSFYSENVQGENCAPLKSVTVPSTVTALNRTFYGCKYLEEITLQEGSLASIGEKTFSGCEALKKIDIPPTVQSIGDSAFAECTSLKTLIFPPSVTQFNGNVYFDTGSNIDSVYILAEDFSMDKGVSHSSANTIYCPAGSAAYQKYLSIAERNRWTQGRIRELTPDMLTLSLADAEAEGYQGVYDAESHPLASVTGARESDKISCRIYQGETPNGEKQPSIAEGIEPGVYQVEITLTRMGVDYISTVQAQIQKKTAVLQLADTTVNEKTNYTVTPVKYEGEGQIVYTYYYDAALKNKCPGRPTSPGTYYVRATVAESDHYTAVMSNVAKLQILKTNTVTPPATISVKKVSLKKVKSPAKKTLEIRWKKTDKASGYNVQIALNKKFTKGKKAYTIKSGKTTKKTIRKLKRKKKYYVRVRAYRKVNGKKYTGDFSKVKSAKIK